MSAKPGGYGFEEQALDATTHRNIMPDEIITPLYQQHETKIIKRGGEGACGGIYFFAFLGALIYFIQHAATFWEGVLGFLKAIAWPAVLVYKALELLKM